MCSARRIRCPLYAMISGLAFSFWYTSASHCKERLNLWITFSNIIGYVVDTIGHIENKNIVECCLCMPTIRTTLDTLSCSSHQVVVSCSYLTIRSLTKQSSSIIMAINKTVRFHPKMHPNCVCILYISCSDIHVLSLFHIHKLLNIAQTLFCSMHINKGSASYSELVWSLNASLMPLTLTMCVNANVFQKISQAFSRTTGPNIGLLILILMHFPCWFQIWVEYLTILKVLGKISRKNKDADGIQQVPRAG